jgi:hypothetical protein
MCVTATIIYTSCGCAISRTIDCIAQFPSRQPHTPYKDPDKHRVDRACKTCTETRMQLASYLEKKLEPKRVETGTT